MLAAALAGGVLGACAPGDSSGGSSDRPDVLLVTLDTTRVDRLGTYGYSAAVTPTVDALADDGVRFERAISTSGLTSMAHASIFTGKNPYRHGLRVFHGAAGSRLSEEQTTLPVILSSEGWQTGAFVSAFTASAHYGFGRGFDVFDAGASPAMQEEELSDLWVQQWSWLREPEGQAQRRADPTVESALEWLDGVEGPFFMWLHFFDPHDPYLIPPDEYHEPLGFEAPEPTRARDQNKLENLARLRGGIYDPEVHFMDAQLGRVIAKLKELGRYDQTLVAVLADHGQGLGDHGWWRHRLIYQEQIHIPLILRLPGGPRGVSVEAQVRNIDVFPTVLEVVGLPVADDVEGLSLVDLARGGSEPEPRIGYAEALNTLEGRVADSLPQRHRDLLFSVQDGRWKLIHHEAEPERSELYDLKNDPRELKNVLAQHPEEHARLMGILDRLGARRIELGDVDELDPEVRAQLEALGYLESDEG